MFANAQTAKSLRTVIASGVAAIALIAGSAVVADAPAEAKSTKRCSASVSNTHPHRRQNIDVRVSKVGSGAKITTVANYKTTKTTKRGKANSKGRANIRYNIGGGTFGRKVPVSVTAVKGKTTWICSTSFIPTRKG